MDLDLYDHIVLCYYILYFNEQDGSQKAPAPNTIEWAHFSDNLAIL